MIKLNTELSINFTLVFEYEDTYEHQEGFYIQLLIGDIESWFDTLDITPDLTTLKASPNYDYTNDICSYIYKIDLTYKDSFCFEVDMRDENYEDYIIDVIINHINGNLFKYGVDIVNYEDIGTKVELNYDYKIN